MSGNLVYAASRVPICVALVMPWERRGDFHRMWADLLGRDDTPRKPLAWKRLKKRSIAFHVALFDELVARRWIRVVASKRGPAAVLARILCDGQPIRLRIEDERLAPRVPQVSTRIVVRDRAPALRVARLLVRLLGPPDETWSAVQRRLGAEARARWPLDGREQANPAAPRRPRAEARAA